MSEIDRLGEKIQYLEGQIDVRDAVISKLSGTVAEWRPLLTRAADAIAEWTDTPFDKKCQCNICSFIAELRKAAE